MVLNTNRLCNTKNNKNREFITKYLYLDGFITKELAMLVESLTIGIIIGVCGLVTWLVKNKFQPEIERDIQEREQKTLKYTREMRESP